MMRSIVLISITLFCGIAFAKDISDSQIDNIIKEDIPKVFGDQRENTFENNSLLRNAIAMFIQNKEGVPFYSGNLVFVSGCRIHSCDEKALVAINQDQRSVAAVALLSHNCHLVANEKIKRNDGSEEALDPRREYCQQIASLKIYLIRNKKSLQVEYDQVILDQLRSWGKKYGYGNESLSVWER
jgi:hypothetical protein